MTIIRTGVTQKYAAGWGRAFGKAEKNVSTDGSSASAKSAKVKTKIKASAALRKKKKPGRRVK